MKNNFLRLFVLGFAAVLISTSVPAHHGYAAYDTDKKVVIKGTVTQWFWANPHCVLQLDVKDDSGQIVHWGAETENPTTMTRQGWSRDSMKPGDVVSVTVVPVKNGKPVGRILEVVLANGQKLAGRVSPAAEVKPDDSLK